MKRYERAALEAWVHAQFRRVGVPDAHARTTARIMVRTQMRGPVTHGVVRIATYLDKLASDEYRRDPQLHIEPHHGVLRMNGQGAMGQVAGQAALDACVALAGTTASALCFVDDIGHLGALGIYPLMAAEQGFFALTMQRTPPMMALPGFANPVIGNSPMAFACPRPDGPPVVFDMASSVAGRGYILQAQRNGEPIPEGWALDGEGQPTTSADEAARGMLLPAGGHKGIGLAMLVECLAGSLAATMPAANNPDPRALGAGATGGQGAFFWVINPSLANDRAVFDARTLQWTHLVHEMGGPAARLPGERAAEAERDAMERGVQVDDPTVKVLEGVARLSGVALPDPCA